MPNPDNCATFFFMTSLFFPFFKILTLSGLPITPELGYCRHSDSRARSLDGGERVKSYGENEGEYQGTLGREVFPPLATPSLPSKRFREHFRTVFDSHSSFFARKPHGKACFAG